MRKAKVYYNKVFAGYLIEKSRRSYIFRYDDVYFYDPTKPSISVTLSKRKKEHRSSFLFPFFSNMLAEGTNLAIQSRYLKIDERDAMGLLGATASSDSIGAVTVKLD